MTGLSQPLLSAFRGIQLLAADVAEPETSKNWFAKQLDRLSEWLTTTIAPPLKDIQQPIDVWLGGVPMTVAMACCLGLFFVALVWVWLLKRDFVFRGAPDGAWWRDLRVWATGVVIPYMVVYYLFGR